MLPTANAIKILLSIYCSNGFDKDNDKDDYIKIFMHVV